MDQQITNGDLLLVMNRKFGNQGRNLVGKTELTSFNQQQDAARCCHRFGDRGHIEYGIGRHRDNPGFQSLISIGLQPGNLPMPANADHTTGHFFGRDPFRDDGIHRGQLDRIQTDRVRFHTWQCSCGRGSE